MGLFSTKRANTLPNMVASSRVSVSKACSVTKEEREDHLNRAGVRTLLFKRRQDIAEHCWGDGNPRRILRRSQAHQFGGGRELPTQSHWIELVAALEGQR